MRSLAVATILCGVYGASAFAQNSDNFDTSGTGMLKGAYFVRQVLLSGFDQNTGAVGQARSLTGTMTFDGTGGYSFTGQLMDTQAGSTAQSYSTTGNYRVASNGLAEIYNPIDPQNATVFGAVVGPGPSAIVASDTDDSLGYNDIFVAIPAGSGVSNSSLQGSYRVGFIDFLQGNASQVRDGYYTLTSNGSGSFGDVSVNGSMANQGSTDTTQTLSAVTYNVSNAGFLVNFPASSTPLTQLVSGQKALFISSDGNILLGGDVNGFDLIVGIKSASGVSNSSYQGTYYTAGLENDASDLSNGNNNVDSFYGSTVADSSGTSIRHLRLAFFGQSAFDDTEDAPYDFASDGTYDNFYHYFLGVNGQAILRVGDSDAFGLVVGFQAPQFTATGVFIDPTRVVNAASFAPITNSVAPGEYITLFGSGLASSTAQAQAFPLPTNLGGVQVTVNGRLAPLSYVSPTQVNLLVPNATGSGSTEFYAIFQVSNNGTASNQAMTYLIGTAPGVFGGTGPAALLHADYSLVTQANPAKPGETLQLYATGLGTVTQPVADGAAAPSSPLSTVDADTIVEILDDNGYHSATLSFKGLAPDFAGLYQVNFVVPSGLTSGLNWVNIGTPDAYTSEAKIYTQ